MGEREDILADVYGNAGDLAEEDAKDDAALTNAWKAIQGHMSSSDEDGEQLIAAEDDLHQEDFFPGSSPGRGVGAAVGASSPSRPTALEVESSSTMLAFGDPEPQMGVLSNGASRPVFGGPVSGKTD